MSILDDLCDQDVQDIMERNNLYRQRIKKAHDIILRAIEVGDYTPDTYSDLLEALEGEYDE